MELLFGLEDDDTPKSPSEPNIPNPRFRENGQKKDHRKIQVRLRWKYIKKVPLYSSACRPEKE
jgi:hypothetical protein